MSTQKKIILIIAIVIIVLVVIKVIGALNRKSEVEEMSMPTEMIIQPTESSESELQAPAAQTTQPQVAQPVMTSPATTVIQPMTPENIQMALRNAGYDPGPIDGKIGSKTKAAIIDFQKANNLTADGKVGPKTWAKLSGFLSSGQ